MKRSGHDSPVVTPSRCSRKWS